MSRLIIGTFSVLGLAFYVMSDGPDFEPRGVRTAEPERVAKATKPAPEPLVEVKSDQLVTRSAIRLVKPSAPAPEPVPEKISEEDTKALLAQVAAGLNSDLSLFDDKEPTFTLVDNEEATFTLASLEQGATMQQVTVTEEPELTQEDVVEEPPKDIREVSGTRVNMRDGPGTIYPVITKVSIGKRVEVLDDPGTGWLRLRVLPEQQIGWISASLIRKIQN